MRAKGIWIILSLLWLNQSIPATADLYSYVDRNGVVHFSNSPTDASYEYFSPETLPVHPAKIINYRSSHSSNEQSDVAEKKEPIDKYTEQECRAIKGWISALDRELNSFQSECSGNCSEDSLAQRCIELRAMLKKIQHEKDIQIKRLSVLKCNK
jgi:hypothetical protein